MPRRNNEAGDQIHDLRDEIQRTALRTLHRERDAWDQALRQFHWIREDYPADLQRFLGDAEEGRVIGTKTDFDREYFCARRQRNREVAHAEERYEQAREDAWAVGAMSEGQRSFNFPARSDDGYADHIGHTEMEHMQDPEIDRWRHMCAGPDGMTVADEPVLGGERRPGRPFTPVGIFDSLSQRCDIASGRHRKRIDAWRDELADVVDLSAKTRREYLAKWPDGWRQEFGVSDAC